MGVDVEVKGAWRINAFLFLLTGSQAVLLPWSPVILKAAGVSAAGVGIVMGVITLTDSMGILGCLIGMRRTHSGASRRFILLLLTVSASAFHISAVMLLPTYAGGNTCLSSSAISFGASNSQVLLSSNDSESSFHVTTTAVTFDLSTSASQHKLSTPNIVTQLSTAGKNVQDAASSDSYKATNLISVTAKEMMVNPEMTTENKLKSSQSTKEESSQTNVGTLHPGTTSIATTSGVLSEKVKNYNSTEDKIENPKLDKTESSTPNKTENPKSDQIENSTRDGTENSKPDKIHNSTPDKSKDSSEFNNNSSDHKTNSFKANDTLESSHSSNSPLNTSSMEASSGKDDLDVTSLNSKVPQRVSTGMEEDTLAATAKLTVSTDEATYGTVSASTDYDDYYYDNNEDSKPVYKFLDPKPVRPYSSFESPNKYQAPGRSPVISPPPPPPNVQQNENDVSWNSNNLFQAYGNNPSQGFKIPQTWLNAFQESNGNSDVLHSLKPKIYKAESEKAPLRTEQQGSHVPFNHQKYHGHERQDSARNEFQPQNPYPARDYGRSGQYRDQYHKRGKRSIQPKDQSLDQKALNSNGTDVAKTEKTSSHDNDVSIRSIMDSISSPVGIQAGVAILLILGSLVGSGVEVGVAKLWHCYVHGYDDGSINQDILQRTITHTFQLSVYAAHKSWTGLTSGSWVVGGGVIASLACMMGVKSGVYSMLGGVQLALGLCAFFMLLAIPVPYGSVEPPKTRRPLSLYLDDEVMREGVRRLAFHIWVLVNGCAAALPVTFRMWVILEMTHTQEAAVAAQTGVVAVTLASESLALHAQRWLIARVGLQGTMGVGGLALMLYMALMWASQSISIVVISHAGLGCSMALIWVSVRHNALLLATINDQEREAWVSWWCWRVGIGVGAVVWGSYVDARASVSELFMPAAFIAASVALAVATAAVVTSRNHGRTRRRIYHTLDLDMAGDDENNDDEDEANEDDWLVKRAKKEGLEL